MRHCWPCKYKKAKGRLKETTQNIAEDSRMGEDIPKTISELKDHPLYVLQRHLLKFQAIYPDDIVPVGFIKKEAIYPRGCVYELRTRESWMKQGRYVKSGEEPYKIVKARPKWKEKHLKREVFSPCFGIWQTEVYVPPPVVDGKIPKNEHGNVELLKPSMLPEGAVHLPMEKMKHIARKLNIDHAPAMIGWHFHNGFSHPVFEGVVVAKEFEDILLDAWNRDKEEREKKEELKRGEKVVYDNWKKLIKGLLIRTKLNKKNTFEEEGKEQTKKSSNQSSKRKANQPAPKNKKNKTDNEMVDGGCDEDEDVDFIMTPYWPSIRIDE